MQNLVLQLLVWCQRYRKRNRVFVCHILGEMTVLAFVWRVLSEDQAVLATSDPSLLCGIGDRKSDQTSGKVDEPWNVSVWSLA